MKVLLFDIELDKDISKYTARVSRRHPLAIIINLEVDREFPRRIKKEHRGQERNQSG